MKLLIIRKRADFSKPVAEMYDNVLAEGPPFLIGQGDSVSLRVEDETGKAFKVILSSSEIARIARFDASRVRNADETTTSNGNSLIQ